MSDWLKWSRWEVTVTLYSEKCSSFLKMTPTASDCSTSSTHSPATRGARGWSRWRTWQQRTRHRDGSQPSLLLSHLIGE